MKDGFDLRLLDSGSLVKKGYSLLIANVGKAIAAITLAVAALVSFTDVGFSSIEAEGFTSMLVMMLIASYVMYFSLEDAGEKLGRDTEDYKHALAEYAGKRDRVIGEEIGGLRRFCLEYTRRELDYRRENALLSLGYTADDLEAYRRGEKMPVRMRLRLRRIDRMPTSRLTASSLLERGGARSGAELKNPKSDRLLTMILRLIPYTVCMIFTVSVIISVKENLTPASVIEGILKLSTLPIIGLKGYGTGYDYVITKELGWLKTKCDLLDSFDTWKKQSKSE